MFITEKPCGKIRIIKRKEMDVRTKNGRVLLLFRAIHKIAEVNRKWALKIANFIVDDTTIVSSDEERNFSADLDKAYKKIDSVSEGEIYVLDIYPSFLKLVSEYAIISKYLQNSCFGNYAPVKLPKESLETCWKPIIVEKQGYFFEDRLAWAQAQIKRVREINNKRKKYKLPPLDSRYESGRIYGNLMFICHPYMGFLDDQIWMTSNGNIYWVNERSCLLDSFRQGIISAAAMVLGAYIAITIFVAAYALISLGVAAPPVILAIKDKLFALVAGKTLSELGLGVWCWVLSKPIEVAQIVGIGVELLIALQGTDAPPISPFDQLEFLVVVGATKGGKVFQRVAAEVIDVSVETASTLSKSKTTKEIKCITEEIVSATAEQINAFKQGKAIVNKTKVQSSQNLSSSDLDVKLANKLASWLEKHEDKYRFKSKLLSPNFLKENPDLAEAIKRFAIDDNGFERVLSEAICGSENKEQGARFVISFALEKFSSKDVQKGLVFEMKQNFFGSLRYVDIYFQGTKYEIKSVKRISTEITKNKTTKADILSPGELIKDLIKSLGTSEDEMLENTKKVKWVFDSNKITIRTKKKYIEGKEIKETLKQAIANRLKKHLAKNKLFKSWPQSKLKEIQDSIDQIIVIFPPE